MTGKVSDLAEATHLVFNSRLICEYFIHGNKPFSTTENRIVGLPENVSFV